MQLTWLEQIWVLQLIHRRRHPLTRARYILRAAVGCALYFALGFALLHLLGRTESSPSDACFLGGAFTCSALMLLAYAVRRVLQWRLTETIINWDRIEELHGTIAKKGV
jgi:hypothetical protein